MSRIFSLNLNHNEIQNHRKRKGIIDFDRLMDLLGFENLTFDQNGNNQ